MNIGSRLTKFREAKGLSKNKLAKNAGVTQGFISQIEAGNRLPTLDVLNRICAALGITLAEFFSEEEPALFPDLHQLLREAEALTPEQRLKLVEFIKSMKGE